MSWDLTEHTDSQPQPPVLSCRWCLSFPLLSGLLLILLFLLIYPQSVVPLVYQQGLLRELNIRSDKVS